MMHIAVTCTYSVINYCKQLLDAILCYITLTKHANYHTIIIKLKFYDDKADRFHEINIPLWNKSGFVITKPHCEFYQYLLKSSRNLPYNFHYENTPIQIYTKFHLKKTEKIHIKKSDTFHISAQNIDCGYSLEPPHRGGSNEYPQAMFLSRNKKNNVYPCEPKFYYIKVGFKGVKIM